MDKNLEIFCANIGEYIKVEGGETLHSVARRLAPQLGFEPICAHVNNKNEGLQYRVYMPKMVEFMSIDSASGMRTYVRSLCMMLYRAVQSVFPATTLKIEHSIGHGWFCRLSPNVKITPQVISRLKAELQRLHSANLPFEYFEQLTGDVIDFFDKQGLNEKVKLLESLRPLYTKFYRLEGLADSYYGCLAPTTGAIDSFDLVAYEDGFILLGRNQKCDPRPKMFRAFTDYVLFNRIVGVSNVGEMNEVTERGEARSLINVAEALHNNKIAHIADDITRRYEQGGARIVLVAGPSSSGKTTFTKRLGIQLMTNLLEPKMISLDDYFVNRADTPLDADGDYDYESLYALDLKQFNADLSALLRGEEIELPTYN
ncbi:MAG: nucleoside kinase, partial [Muribaculaceae bacterium]|nr:nucleoside kinase [Muribaculaceae bacterium]